MIQERCQLTDFLHPKFILAAAIFERRLEAARYEDRVSPLQYPASAIAIRKSSPNLSSLELRRV